MDATFFTEIVIIAAVIGIGLIATAIYNGFSKNNKLSKDKKNFSVAGEDLILN